MHLHTRYGEQSTVVMQQEERLRKWINNDAFFICDVIDRTDTTYGGELVIKYGETKNILPK